MWLCIHVHMGLCVLVCLCSVGGDGGIVDVCRFVIFILFFFHK